MKRIVEEELLDLPDQPIDEVAESLEDLRAINARTGGNRLHAHLLQQAAERNRSTKLQLLEVASGRADVMQYAALQLQSARRSVDITLLDQNRNHFPFGTHWNSRLPEPHLVLGNALQMPFEDATYDIVSCCLFTHHLDPDHFAQFVLEALRVTRTAVVINDLERNRLHWLLAKLGRVKFRSRFTVHDAPVSVRRAYTLSEMRNMLHKLHYPFEIHRAPLFRLGAIIWKP